MTETSQLPRAGPRDFAIQIGFVWNQPGGSIHVQPIDPSRNLYPLSFVFLQRTGTADDGNPIEQVYEADGGRSSFDCRSGTDDSASFVYHFRVGDRITWEIFDLSTRSTSRQPDPRRLGDLSVPFEILDDRNQPPHPGEPFRKSGYQPPQWAEPSGYKTCDEIPGADGFAHPYWTPPSGSMALGVQGQFQFQISFAIQFYIDLRKYRIDTEMIVGPAG